MRIPIPAINYQPLNVVDIGPVQAFHGVSTLDPYSLPVGSATSMKNLTGSGGVSPALTARNAFAQLGANIGNVTGLGLHMNVTLHALAGGAWQKWNGSAFTNVGTGFSTTAVWSTTNFKGNLAAINLIAVNGVDTARKYDGTTLSNLAGVPSGVNFKLIDQHDSRLYATDGKSIYYSGIGQGETWSATASTLESGGGIITVETNTGEDVNAIKAGLKHLMIFKRNAFIELFGTRPSNFQMQTISETGAVGPNAVTVRDQTAYWLHDAGAFEYSGGLPRKDFSLPVIGYIHSMNKAAAQNACVVSTQDSVLFSFPTGNSVVNDTTLEYLPDVGIWTVWQDFAPKDWLLWNNTLVYGDANGVFQQGTAATNVAWEWISTPLGGGKPMYHRYSPNKPFSDIHQWYKLWYLIDVPLGSTLTVSVSRKAEGNAPGDWIQVNTSATVSDTRRVILPLSQIANSNYLRVKLAGTGPVKFHEINIQQREIPLI